MKVSNRFIFRNVAQEHLLIPVGKAAMEVKGLIAMSESAAMLYEMLQKECSREDLIAALMAEYEVDEAVATEDTEAFLNQMRQLNMLVED